MSPPPGAEVRRLERWAWRSAQAACLGAAALGAGIALGEPSAASGTVAYRLAWDTTGVERLADGSWRYVGPDGVEVVVTAGTLTTRSLTVVACPHGHGLLDRLLAFVAAAPAAAGHGGTDELALEVEVTEDLVALAPTDAGAVTTDAAEPSYCEVHAAVAGGSAAARIDGTSTATLHVEALVDGVAVVVDTDVPWGWRSAFTGPVALQDDGEVVVDVVRSAAALAGSLATDADGAEVLRTMATSATAAVPDQR